jgi:hypothetical protein
MTSAQSANLVARPLRRPASLKNGPFSDVVAHVPKSLGGWHGQCVLAVTNPAKHIRTGIYNNRFRRTAMNTHVLKLAVALLTGLASATITESSAAAETSALMLAPDSDAELVPPPALPKFGFSSVNIHGIGERVTNVRWGGLASRFGLEPGDLILSMNGFPLTYNGSWNDALYSAIIRNGGWVRLRIRDVRTGIVVQRRLFVGGGHGPIEHYHVGHSHTHFGLPSGPVTQKSTIGPINSKSSRPISEKIESLMN